MASTKKTEARRQELQVALDAERSPEERNKLGQFATPTELARQIASVAVRYLGEGPMRFLDPSIGSGAFYSALLTVAGSKRVTDARGIELDARFVEVARLLWGDTGLKITSGDFTATPPPTTQAERATLLLANPPYVRHHHLEREQKVGLQIRAEQMLGSKVSGLAGLYVFFMLLAHEWMAESGVAAWLVPSEWMDVNYGSALKEYLCKRVHLLRVHRFEAADVQFGDALVSSAVVFFQKQLPEPGASCEFTVGSLDVPARTQKVGVTELRTARKWGLFFREGHETRRTAMAEITLGDLFEVKRGIATGCNDFFVRAHAEFLEMGVPDRFLRPIIPSSRHLVGDEIGRRSDGYPDVEEPLALLDCSLPEDEVRKRHPKLWAYLESPLGQQVRTGYLTSGRNPWYSQEQRAWAPVISTYMGRGRKGAKPFRFFWNRSDATATNVYLMLIPKPPMAAVFRRDPSKAKCVADYLTETDVAELLGHGRVYGGGLHKLEPKELGRLDASRLAERLGVKAPPRREQLSLDLPSPRDRRVSA